MTKLNPEVRKISVGKKSLTEFEVYPLSIGDQKKVSRTLIDAYKSFSERVNNLPPEEQERAIDIVIDAVYEDIPKVLALVIDEDLDKSREVFDSMSNPQLSELVDMVWEMNYECLEKNRSGLFRTIISAFRQGQADQEVKKKVRKLKKS